jgi:hypothetical protein
MALASPHRILSAALVGAALIAAASAMWLGAGGFGTPGGAAAEPTPAAPPEIEGPFVHDNLAVYLLRGPDRLDLEGVITLAEALEQGKAVVRETGDVNELQVENLADVGVFIEAGDIVKGGQQDRVLATDLVVPPKSGPIPIDAFCVEQGRWSARGDEPAAHFASSDDALPARQLKLAAKEQRSQGAVWAEVAKLQEKLAVAAAKPVTGEASHTSLQLTLENEEVEKGVTSYLDALAHRPAGRDDVVGFAFAVNGEVVSADLYGASKLARERWPKLLRAAAVEAFAGRGDQGKVKEPPAAPVVAEVLARAEESSAAASTEETLELVVDSDRGSYQLLESRGKASKDSKKLYHRALVLRD